MDKRIFLAFAAVFLVLMVAWVIGTYCISPIILNARAGDIVLACKYSWPWSLLLGIGWQYYYFNFYVVVGIPGVLLLVWLISVLFKKND
jgi:hypothetical protein